MTDEERFALKDAMARLIGGAWADESFKAALIAEPGTASAKLGVGLPQSVRFEFYDDPIARVGDWSTVGEGADGVLRVPIPARPSSGAASAAELAGVGGGDLITFAGEAAAVVADGVVVDSAAMLLLCCCSGVVSPDADDWY